MPPIWLALTLLGSLSGLLFSAVSTYDFVAHLDRQVHGLHCSLLPGLGAADATGTSGCHVTLMSPYSSIWREALWGGVPISLPAMAVFAFITFWAGMLWIAHREREPTAVGFLVLSCTLPAFASLVMAVISLSALDALCKVCLGIYLSSALCLGAAIMLFRETSPAPAPPAPRPMSTGALGVAFVLGCIFVATSVVAYAASAPEFDGYVGSCGELAADEGPSHVLIPIGPQRPGPKMIEVLDPLCAACRAFERRYEKLSIAEQASRSVVLFPLDDDCNWMVQSAVHPGACAISEAVLCANDGAREVIRWAFEHQEEIIVAERDAAGSAAKRVTERFPNLAGCVGSSRTKAKLNHSLRWAVENKLPVLTPQLYVNGARLCDADTDLGLDYMLTRLVQRASTTTAPEGP